MAKLAVITGGLGALGHGVTSRFEKDGWRLALSAAHEAERAAHKGSGSVDVVDLTDLVQVQEWANRLENVDALILLAGGFAMGNLGEMTNDKFDQQFDINARTAFNALSAFAAKLSRGASVVLVGSQAFSGAKGMSAYAASKAAVVSLMKSASLEFKPRSIRVNAILPDTIDTPANRASMPDADFERWQKPVEVAEVIGFLCSDSSKIVSGNAILLGRI